jgi:hypothetical protein
MNAASLPPPATPRVPARWTAWLIWRQQRPALVLITALNAATCAFLARAGLALEHGGGDQENTLLGLLGFVLLAVPAVVGMFAGAPLLAREHQTGVIRYIRVQGLSPDRWLAGTLILTGTVIAVQAILVGMLFNWVLSLQGYQPELIFNNTSDSQFPTFPAWCVFAYALGVACGALIRRTLPAIAAFLLCYCGVAWPAMRILGIHLAGLVFWGSYPATGNYWPYAGAETVCLLLAATALASAVIVIPRLLRKAAWRQAAGPRSPHAPHGSVVR